MSATPLYTPLWCKSNYSFLEGASFPEQYVSKAAQLGLEAIALTDRDGIYGIVKGHLAAREHKVHLIVGSQITIKIQIPRFPAFCCSFATCKGTPVCAVLSPLDDDGAKKAKAK